MPDREQSFPRLVSLACHDLRTPLATVQGFAKTLTRTGGFEEPAGRYIELIDAASGQIAELLEELSLAARIAGGRWEPAIREVDTLELARAAAGSLTEGVVAVSGHGAAVAAEPEAAERAVRGVTRCALRHGGLDRIDLRVEGERLDLSPIPAEAAPIVLGESLRDLGSAVGVRALRALGATVELEGETLVMRLPRMSD